MFIVQLDEPVLFVYESPGRATRDIEAIDTENGIIRAAFDDSAVPYRVSWIKLTNLGRRYSGFFLTGL